MSETESKSISGKITRYEKGRSDEGKNGYWLNYIIHYKTGQYDNTLRMIITGKSEEEQCEEEYEAIQQRHPVGSYFTAELKKDKSGYFQYVKGTLKKAKEPTKQESQSTISSTSQGTSDNYWKEKTAREIADQPIFLMARMLEATCRATNIDISKVKLDKVTTDEQVLKIVAIAHELFQQCYTAKRIVSQHNTPSNEDEEEQQEEPSQVLRASDAKKPTHSASKQKAIDDDII